MLKALLPVDGSDIRSPPSGTSSSSSQDREPLDVHVLNVQPPLHGDVTTFVPRESSGFSPRGGRKGAGERVQLLDEAGVPYEAHHMSATPPR